VVEKLKEKYKTEHFNMSGAKYRIQISILKDYATITLDTTGASLHKRGYRTEQSTAPLKETLASALIQLSFWKKDRILLDPVCGSGTIPIEAAMIARNIAPGLSRSFDAEKWGVIDGNIWKNVRAEAYSVIDYDFMPEIYASDIDKYCIRIAKHNAENAGVDDCIHFDCRPFSEVRLKMP
jgi:putative N6-adenine-specific DNA methylase